MSKRLGTGESNKPELLTRLDDTSTASTLYVGKANPGQSSAAAVWQIKKVTDTEASFAEGSILFDKVWNDRTTYSYN